MKYLMALFAVTFALALPGRAEWLRWTVDFSEVDKTSPWADPNTTPKVWLVATTDPATGAGGTVLADKWDQPELDMTQGGTKVTYGGTMTDLGDYGSAGYTFFIEMGAMAGQAEYTSQAISYGDLVSTGFVQSGWSGEDGFWNAASVSWAPTQDVPEPTSGILALIGVSLLALRRKQRGDRHVL